MKAYRKFGEVFQSSNMKFFQALNSTYRFVYVAQQPDLHYTIKKLDTVRTPLNYNYLK